MMFHIHHMLWRLRSRLGLTTFAEDMRHFERWDEWYAGHKDADLSVMSKGEEAMVDRLRGRGFAVVVVDPNELRDVSPRMVERLLDSTKDFVIKHELMHAAVLRRYNEQH